MGKEELFAFRDLSSCKLKNVCGQTEHGHSLASGGTVVLPDGERGALSLVRGQGVGAEPGHLSLPRNVSQCLSADSEASFCYFFLNVIFYLLSQDSSFIYSPLRFK